MWLLRFLRLVLMVIGILQVELAIEHAESLKDKRSVVRSLKDRLHREHQVSVAEVDALEEHRRAMLGIAIVGSDVSYIQSVLDRIVDKLREGRDFVLADQDVQILTGQ